MRIHLPGLLSRRQREIVWCYIFLGPILLCFVAFTLWPVIASWYYTLFDWTGLGNPSRFVGLANYREVVADPYFWKAFKNSFVFALGVVPLKLILALIVAVILNSGVRRGVSFYRAVFFMPVVTNTAVIGLVMVLIFSPQNGPINAVLLALGVVRQPIDFLGKGNTAMLSLIAVAIWQGLGIDMIYWLSGLQSIPYELYEAARIDGAGPVQCFAYITIPLLKTVAIVIGLLGFINALQTFALVQTMTGGGPFYSTQVMGLYIYEQAFGAEGIAPRMGYASTAAVAFGVVASVLVLVQGLWSGRFHQMIGSSRTR